MTAASDGQDQWLVRTHQNLLTGPFKQEEVLRLIREGVLGLQDEVCRSSQYWFYLHVRDEVRAQLGIEPPVRKRRKGDKRGVDEDITETETETANLLSVETAGQVDTNESASVMAPRRVGAVVRTEGALEIPPVGQVSVRGRVERPQVWKGIAVILTGIVIALVYMVIDILKG